MLSQNAHKIKSSMMHNLSAYIFIIYLFFFKNGVHMWWQVGSTHTYKVKLFLLLDYLLQIINWVLQALTKYMSVAVIWEYLSWSLPT
jgi:hypothetical protein